MSTEASHPLISRRGEPTWEITRVFPEQGDWLESDYLRLPELRSIEFDAGFVEVLPSPTFIHEAIAILLVRLLHAYVQAHGLGGTVLAAGFNLRIPRGKFRQPDVMYMNGEQISKGEAPYTRQATIVIEVVSPDDPSRDYVTKRAEYASANVPEYWIVDPTRLRSRARPCRRRLCRPRRFYRRSACGFRAFSRILGVGR